MKRFKAEIILTVTYENDCRFYPKGSSLEDCLRIDLAKFRDNPEFFSENGHVQIKGRIIEESDS